MNKVFKNYRDHPALRYDGLRLVFKIDDKVFLIEDGIVKHIKVVSIQETNIGEPYRKLVRLTFITFNADNLDVYEDYIDFHISDQQDLIELLEINK
jgi:hypothetical protein